MPIRVSYVHILCGQVHTSPNMEGFLPTLLTPDEAAAELAISRTVLYDLLRDKRLGSVKIGRSRRIPAAAISDYVESISAENTETSGFSAE